MRTIVRLSPLLAMVGVIALATGILESGAFHSNVDAGCNACHIMHASQDGQDLGPNPKLMTVGGGCLEACHGQIEQGPSVLDGSTELPGGNYSFSAADPATGHNPGSGSSTIPIDPIHGLTPPGGGGIILDNWSCNSCHDTYGGFEYRLLRKDPGHLDNDLDGVIIATEEHKSQIWDRDSLANVDQSDTNHNVYITETISDKEVGFGRWCAACHPDFHGADKSDPEVGDGEYWIRHPTAVPMYTEGGNINVISIVEAFGNSYDYEYPLETMNGQANTSNNWILSESEDGITCLTCHKAHASEYPDALRWDNSQEEELEPGVGCRRCHVEQT